MTSCALALGCALVQPVSAHEIDAGALASLPGADVVILGEVHDNPAHHTNQALAVAAIAPAALVFEMLTEAQAGRVTPALRGDAQALAEALEWAGSGWPDFAMYHPIFMAAPQAGVFGAAVPRAEARRVFEEPLADVFGPDAARYGLDADLPEAEQSAREAGQMAAHCDALPEALLPGMVAAQRLRDAELARTTLAAYAATGGPVVVITGTGHARRDHGVPAALARAAPGLSVLSIGQFEEPAGHDAPFDFWLVTDPAPRPDPCAAFR